MVVKTVVAAVIDWVVSGACHRTTVDQCSKNATKMKPVPRHNATRQQAVEAIVQTVAEPFLYFLKSVENPPYIRFTVPGDSYCIILYKGLIVFGHCNKSLFHLTCLDILVCITANTGVLFCCYFIIQRDTEWHVLFLTYVSWKTNYISIRYTIGDTVLFLKHKFARLFDVV